MTIRDRIILILALPVFVVVSTGVASLVTDGDLHPISPLAFIACCFASVCVIVYVFARWPR